MFIRKPPDQKEPSEKFGDLIFTDHLVFGDNEAGHDGERTALMIADDATDLRDLPALKTKEADEADLALRTFMGKRTLKCMFSDRSKELKKVARKNG